MYQGWICPRCDRVMAPFVTECQHCNRKLAETLQPVFFPPRQEPLVVSPSVAPPSPVFRIGDPPSPPIRTGDPPLRPPYEVTCGGQPPR